MKSGKSYKRNLLLAATLISLSATMPMAVAVDYTDYHSSTTTYNDFATADGDNRKYILDDNIDLGNNTNTLWGINLLIEGNNKTIFQSFDEGGDWAFTSQTTPAKSIIIQNLGSFTLVSTDPETHKKVYTVNNTGYASNLPNGKSYGAFFLANNHTPSAITLTIDKVVISDYTEQSSNSGLITLNAASTIQNSLFKDNTQRSLISLLSENTIRNTNSVNILNTAFVNNAITSDNYTALINSPSPRGNTKNAENELYIKDSYFEGNKGTNGGGLIYWNTQNGVEVDNSVFINNGTSYAGVSSSMAIGGAIDATNLDIKDSYFEGNYHKNTHTGTIYSWVPVQAGGAISSTLYKDTTSSTVSIDNTDFKGNYVETAKLDALGGAIYLKDAITTITNDSDFTGNSVTSTNGNAYGGAIYQSGGTLTISGSTFGGTGEGQGNSANSTNGYAYGGAIYNTSESGTISADFISNSANGYKSYGGAIYNEGAITSINNSTFANNSVTSENNNVEGGAIYNGSLHTIGNIGADFTNNSASGKGAYGGAIHNYSSKYGTTSIGAITKITNGFKGNSATVTSGNAYGGAIYNSSGFMPDPVFTPSYVSIGNLNTDFTQNHVEATGYAFGGAIYNATDPTYKNYNRVSVGNIDGNFSQNYAYSTGDEALGGAIYNRSASIGTINGTFTDNYAKTDSAKNASGGAIFVADGTFGNITADFEGNYTLSNSGQANGGAIYINDSTSNTVGSIKGNFTNNYAKSTSTTDGSQGAAGGAILNGKSGSSTASDLTILSGSSFTGNYVESFKVSESKYGSVGGAIYQSGGNLTITDTAFTGNYAKGNNSVRALGGAIYNDLSSATTKTAAITNSSFTDNYTTTVNNSSLGGAVYQYGGNYEISGTTFGGAEEGKGNYATSTSGEAKGGAIYQSSGNLSVTDSDFISNSATSTNSNAYGGAIYNYLATITNLSADFTGNSATTEKTSGNAKGGALYNEYRITTLSGEYSNNSAQSNGIASGGAIYNAGFQIENLSGTFTGNYADGVGAYGGAIYNSGKIVTIDGATFKDNYVVASDGTQEGAAIYNSRNITTIQNSTFDHNTGAYAITNKGPAQITDITGNTFIDNTTGAIKNDNGYIQNITGNTFGTKVGDVIHGNKTAILNTNTSTIDNITGTFAYSTDSAIKNYHYAYADNVNTIGSINATFTNNSSENMGGAILNYSGYSSSSKTSEAIHAQITSLTGDFSTNSVTSADNRVYGGAIANIAGGAGYPKVSIGSISGKTTTGFNGNFVRATGSSNGAYGGAIANVDNLYSDYSKVEMGDINANFTGNSAQSNVRALGGAIYSNSTIGTITGDFTGNYAQAADARGGAIATLNYLEITDSSFSNNYVTGTDVSNGGAIYAEASLLITAATKDINFTENKADNGAAIHQNEGYESLMLYAQGGNIKFTNNNEKGDATGINVGIYSAGEFGLAAEEGKKITVNDRVQTDKGLHINYGLDDLVNPVGTVEFNNYILANGNNNSLVLRNGTIKLNAKAAEALNTDSFEYAFENLDLAGGTIDILNNNIDKIKPLAENGSNITGAINLMIDVDTTANTGDSFVSDIYDGNVGVGSVIIKAINIINDDAEDARIQVGSGSVSQIMQLANEYVLSGGNYDITGEYDSENLAYYLKLTALGGYDDINSAVIATDKTDKKYSLKNQGESGGETVTGALGALVGHSLTVNGKNLFLDGKVGGVNQGGFIVADGQTLTLKNISSLKNFTIAVDNAGTLNVENVTFAYNSIADINNTGTATIKNSDVAKIVNSSTVNVTDSTIRNIKNTGVLNISDTDGTPVNMLLITDNGTPDGITNITGGYTQFVGNVTQKTINLKGGNLTLENNATVNANIVADGTVDKTGYLNINSNGSTINGTISGTFKGNDDIAALSNAGTVGNVTANFVNNTHSGSSDIKGGAIYNTGTMGTISGNFTGNSATSSSGNAYGGAIYQNGGTLTINGATFGGSEEGQGNSAVTDASGKTAMGGAIYQVGGSLSVTDSKFINNTTSDPLGYSGYTSGGAIFLKDGSANYSITGTKTGTGTSATSTTEFISNQASEGGAINIFNTSGTIDGVVFNGNGKTTTHGSAVLYHGGTQKIDNSVFIANNSNSTSNAVVEMNNTGSLTVDNSEFINNASMYAVHSYRADMTIKNSEFSGNGLNSNEQSSVISASPYNNTTNIYDTNIKNNYGNAIGFSDASSGTTNTLNIIANEVGGGVEISGNSGYGILVQDRFSGTTDSSILLYAKNGDILMVNNAKGTIGTVFGFGSTPTLTLNADTGHNITINDAITYTKNGLNINADNNAGTVALNGALTLGDVISVGGGTLELGSTAVTSLNKAISTNSGTVKLTGGTLTQNIAGATTITGTVIDNNATLGNITITNTGNFTDNGGAFTTADNAGTFNVNGVTLTATGTSINNTAKLNLSGNNEIKTITGNAGTTNITGGTTTISQDGSATQKVINISDGELIADYGTTITATEGVKLQGGTLKAQNGATVNNIIADEHYTGNRLVVLGGGFSSLEGTFKGSNTYRALDYNSATALTIDGVTFDSNAAGAIYHSWSGTVDSSISNSTFTNNSNEYDGGAYYQFSTNGSDHTVLFNNVTFTSNSATNKGGAILAGLNAVNKLNISNSTFTSNTVTSANGIGSAIYLQGIAGAENTPSSFTIDNSTFTSNGAGGVVYANGGNLTVKNSTFTSNSGDAIVLADNYQYWTIIGGQITAVYSPITANIVAETGNVSITGNSGWGIVGNNNHETESALTLYAKSGNITINGNTAGGINNNGLALTLNADEDHNITIANAVSSTTGMTVNADNNAGTVALNGALTLGDVISVGGGTLELGSTAVTSLNKAISTNSGTVKLTGGTLTQAIAGNTTVSGSDVTLGTNGSLVNATVANGAKLTSQASQFTTMNNLGTLLLSGTLDKAISGTGETKINQTLTFAEGENPAKASIAGTLNMNSGTLNMVEEETPAYTNYTVGTLKGSGNLAIDFDGTHTDKLTITTADETPITVTLTALNGFTKGQDAVSAKTILSGASNITLEISNALREAYDDTVITPNNYDVDPISSAASWTQDLFKKRYYDISTGKQLTVDNSTANKTLEYKYTVQNIYDSTKDVSQGDTLALVNQKEDTTRTFTTTDKTATYNVGSVLGDTGAGKITVQGATDGTNTSTLNMAGNTGFVIGSDAEVELNTVKVTNTANSEGSLINNTAGTATLNNVEIASNSVNVISSSGTLGVTNSTVNAGVNNDGTMNLNGTNQIASVEGSNGTANVQTGTTTVGSIFQKLISIESGGKLASNGNVTATNGITNNTTKGLSITNGKLTGNVTGEGSTKFSGTSSIANGSVVGQAITVVDGKLTTLANGLGGAVANGGTVELTGGNLTKEISGVSGSTVINTASDVTIGTDGSISQTLAIQAGTLKTGVNGFTQNITSNAGVVELTGTGSLNKTIAGNTTVSGTADITNNGSLANVTIADGGVLTSASDKISGTINNGGTLRLSGDLNKTISGSGETIANSDLTIGTNANVTGTLNANGKTLSMSGDSLATQTNVGTLKGSGTLSINVINNSGSIVSDSIKATTYDDSVALKVTNMTGFADVVNGLTLSTTTGENVGFNLNVLNGYEGNGLTIADAYTTAYHNVGKNVDRSHTEELTSTVNWSDIFTEETWTDNYNQTLTVSNGTIAYNIVKTGETEHQFAAGDTLQMLNTATQFGTTERKFVTTDAGATYDVTADSLGATAAGTMTVKGATAGTNTSTIDMKGKTGFVVSNAGTTLNLDTVNITGTKTADGSLINNTAGEVNLNNVSVATNTNDVIANNSTMNLTGSNDINSGITGTGTTNVKSGTSIIDRITQKVVEIFGGSKLETETVTASEQVKNAGDLTITGASNSSKITGTGTTEFTNNLNNAGDISQGTVKVADGKTLTTTGDITTDTLTNGGTVTLNSADTTLTIKGGTAETPTTVAGTINGTGSTVIEGNAQNNGTIASAVEIATSGKLSTNADKVTGAINNGGNLDLTGGDIKNAISGDGNTTISGTVTNSTGKNIGNAITVASTGNLTTAADKIGGTVENNGTTNGLTLTGGQLSQNVTGSGKTVIAGTDVSVKYGNSIAQDIEITSGNKLVNTNVSSIGGDVENYGDIQLYSQDNGKLEHDITGTGTTELNRDITVAANIDNTINIKSYTDGTGTHNANVTVESGNNFGKAGQNITVDSNNSLTMQSASDIKGNLVDNGTVELQGGTISNAISGTGAVNITGNTTNNAANTVAGAVSVAENVELAIGTSGNTFNSASSLKMGNGSTLNLQNGSADIVNDNLAVATDKIANLAMDWGDSIGSTNNINGKLNVSDVDLTATTSATTPTSYAIATGSNLGNVVLDESVNLKTNDTSFNQVKYNSTTGAFTGAKNNLAQAVNTTEDGESAIYSMSSDEPAGTLGTGVLDGGKLIVQGNGNTITGYGIEVGDGTHNAILTIKDANMKDITGDALLVKGGNTVTVMAENSDIEISGTTGNAITLNKDTNGNSIVNIEGGSHTVTIENDIISDDSGNTIKFNSGTINFNGKFDPAAAVVGGATVNRGGDDDDIDWTVTSGTLNYLQDSYLNRATNTMNLNGGTLNTVNGVVTDFALGGFTLSNDSNFYADVDLAAGKMDNFISTPTTYTGGTLHVAGLNLISDATADNTSIPFANSTLAGHVDYTGAQGLTALSPIYKYNVGYNSSNGNFDFARYNSGGYDGINPAIMAAPVAAQMGGYLTQLNSYDEAFRNMDMYMLMTAQQRQALKNKNKIASLDGGVLYDATLMRQERAEGWFRPFATFEKVGLRNGPKVENIAYGSYMGGESQMYDLGHGWDGLWGAYVGYNGSHQNYDGVSIYQNGGTLGVLGMAYKGNFFTGLTINAGASGVEASTMYGNENFAMLMAGIASKTGYNWELFNGKFIIQPSMLMSYSFVNTFDYKNAAGVNVDSDPLHAIQLQPEIKFIGNLKNGWQPYASVAMVWNIMDNTKFKANDVSLPELSVKPYVKYGVGVRKTWGERLTGFFQTYLTNGGRNGVGLQAGFTWAFGGGKDKKADEKKIQKSLNKTPELKKTEIVLNGKKVQ